MAGAHRGASKKGARFLFSCLRSKRGIYTRGVILFHALMIWSCIRRTSHSNAALWQWISLLNKLHTRRHILSIISRGLLLLRALSVWERISSTQAAAVCGWNHKSHKGSFGSRNTHPMVFRVAMVSKGISQHNQIFRLHFPAHISKIPTKFLKHAFVLICFKKNKLKYSQLF